jgi:protein TonB
MTSKLITCWLLLALGTGAALAQTHPKKKHSRRHTIAKQLVAPPLYSSVVFCGIDDGTEVKPATIPFAPNLIYTKVDQAPTLNGQPAKAASIAAINQYIMISPTAPTGQILMSFDVTKEGGVYHIAVIKGLRADVDSVVVTAVLQLPCFTPGKEEGQVVAVRLTLPVTIPVSKQP